MPNTLIPASFLSTAIGKQINLVRSENHLYVIREETSSEKTSRLYRLFFGLNKITAAVVQSEQSSAEPDYYSSYE